MTTAERTSDFIDSIGANVHMSYNQSAYANAALVVASLQYLGIDHVRDSDLGTLANNPVYFNAYATLAAAGIKFDLYVPSTQALSDDLVFADKLEAAYPGSVYAIEGPNEIGSGTQYVTGGSGYSGLAAFEQGLYNAITGDPALAGVSIYSNSFYDGEGVSSVGNLSSYVTDGAAHIYFQANPPQAGVPGIAGQTVEAPGDPEVITETGYSTDPGHDPVSYAMNVNDDVQAKFTLDLLFDDIQAGAQTVYIYELLDEYSDPNYTSSQSHYGLFNNDGSPKPAAIAIHNLTTIFGDNSATASTFTTGNLNYTISGLPLYNGAYLDSGAQRTNYGGFSYLLEKSNGAFDLAVWAEPALWNYTTVSERVAPPSLVTVSLAQTYQTIEIFDPMVSSNPIEVLHNVSQVQLVVTDHPLIVEVEPNGVGTNAQAVAEPNVFQCQAMGTSATIADNATLQATFVNITDSASSGPVSATIYIYDSSGQATDANGSLAGAGVTKAGVGEYSITAASAAALSAVLQSTIFTPTAHEVAVGKSEISEFTIVLSDGTNTAVERSPNISIVAQETPPSIGGTITAQRVTDAQTDQPFAKTTVTEPDFAAMVSATITLVNAGGIATDADGVLAGAGLTKTGTGIYKIAATNSAALTAELEQLVFTPAAGQVNSGQTVTTNVDLSVSDGTDAATSAVTLTVTGTGPVVSGMWSVTIPEGHTPILAERDASITDAQSAGSETATITLLDAGGNATDADGVVTGAGLTEIGVGTYRLSAASPAAMTAALQQLMFTPTDHQAAPGQTVTTNFLLSVSDGVRTGSAIVQSVGVVAGENAPSIAGTVGNQAIYDAQTVQPFAKTTITDPDFAAAESVTITLVNASGSATDADGTLTGSGLTKIGTGTYRIAIGAPGAVTAALEQLVFTPTAGQVQPGQKVATTFDLSVSDGTDVTTNISTSVVATATGPTPSGSWNAQFPDYHAPVTVLQNFTLIDTDTQASGSETATITLLNAGGSATDANGILSGTGLTRTGTGTYSISAASPAALTAEIRALTFAPANHEVAPGQTVVTNVAVSVSDGAQTGSYNAATVTVTAAETAPAISGAVANQALTDIQTVQPFAKTAVTDPDFGAAESVTITLVNASGSATDADGLLSGTGLTKTGTGTYSLATGTPGAVTAALEQLVFTPTAGQVQPGQKVATTFDLAVSDGTDAATNKSSSVVATAIGPVLSGSWNLQLGDNHAPVTVLQNFTVTDTDTQASGAESATITLLDASGNATDANGSLSGTGLSKTGTGTYSISAASPAALTAAVRALAFGPTNRQVAPGQTVTTSVAVSVSDGDRTGSMVASTIAVVAQGQTIAAGTTYTLASGSPGNNTIYFAGSNAILSVGGTSLPSAAITGFDLNGSTGDEVVLTGYTYVAGKDTVSLGANNVLSLNLNGTVKQLILDPSANYAGHGFSIQTNSANQVVVIDPVSVTTAKMSFLAPVAPPETPATDTSQSNKADLFADLAGTNIGYGFVTGIGGSSTNGIVSSAAEPSGASAALLDLIAQHAAKIPAIPLHAG